MAVHRMSRKKETETRTDGKQSARALKKVLKHESKCEKTSAQPLMGGKEVAQDCLNNAASSFRALLVPRSNMLLRQEKSGEG